MSNPEPLQPDMALSLRDIGKVYRLYQKPAYRVLDLLGMCPSGPGYFHEFTALAGVDLDIPRGQKLAIIGRNGAGKSTLLKIITQTLRPTTGTMRVNGQVSALLQIGTGFHPDFTGRQNVYACFAHLGITGKRADELFDEVVDFAELHEYIDQPVKTYSTGMGARLMFSATTVVQPDILVIDEILGVGDAYFAHKSYDRMRRMCSEQGTTLLLVTHDVYTALNVCDRFIWIDKGRIKMEGDGKSTVNAYEASIKEQEEERLRRRTAMKTGAAGVTLRVRFSSRSGFALPAPLSLSGLSFTCEDGSVHMLPVAEGAPGWTLLPEGNVGEAAPVAGRLCRTLSTHGSIYHKAEWAVSLPAGARVKRLSVDYLYKGDQPVAVGVVEDGGRPLIAGELSASPAWSTAPIDADQAPRITDATGGVYGNAKITIESIELLDADGNPCRNMKRGQRTTARVVVRVRDKDVPRNPTFVLAAHRAGVAYAVRVVDDTLDLPHDADLIEVRVDLGELILGAGTHYLSASLFEPDYFHSPNSVFFTINPRVYCSMVRALEFLIEPTHPVDPMTFAFHPATISVTPLHNQAPATPEPAATA
ncbi:MAG: ABC transporter ATP-binding protein [Planctomycetes bacterium]|nr:ABC transporter ATP-binding protein [Planctomycetota bacterium]